MDTTLHKDITKRMDSALTVLNTHFHKIRTGRAHSSLIEDIKVDYYGNPTPINQMASVKVLDARTLSILPWDKNQLDAVNNAILKSDLGLNPNNSGDEIIIQLPPLTEETRKDYQKHARAEAENARIAIRNVRRDGLHKLKESAPSEDEEKVAHKEIDQLTEDYIKKVDEQLKLKEKELLEF